MKKRNIAKIYFAAPSHVFQLSSLLITTNHVEIQKVINNWFLGGSGRKGYEIGKV